MLSSASLHHRRCIPWRMNVSNSVKLFSSLNILTESGSVTQNWSYLQSSVWPFCRRRMSEIVWMACLLLLYDSLLFMCRHKLFVGQLNVQEIQRFIVQHCVFTWFIALNLRLWAELVAVSTIRANTVSEDTYSKSTVIITFILTTDNNRRWLELTLDCWFC